MSYSNENLTLEELQEAHALKEAEEISEILRIKVSWTFWIKIF